MGLQLTVAQEKPPSLGEACHPALAMSSPSRNEEGGFPAVPPTAQPGQARPQRERGLGRKKAEGWQPWHRWEGKGGGQASQQWPFG